MTPSVKFSVAGALYKEHTFERRGDKVKQSTRCIREVTIEKSRTANDQATYAHEPTIPTIIDELAPDILCEIVHPLYEKEEKCRKPGKWIAISAGDLRQ